MNHAKYIGRVGALALALGVGSAIIGGLGTAAAAPDAPNADHGEDGGAPSSSDVDHQRRVPGERLRNALTGGLSASTLTGHQQRGPANGVRTADPLQSARHRLHFGRITDTAVAEPSSESNGRLVQIDLSNVTKRNRPDPLTARRVLAPHSDRPTLTLDPSATVAQTRHTVAGPVVRTIQSVVAHQHTTLSIPNRPLVNTPPVAENVELQRITARQGTATGVFITRTLRILGFGTATAPVAPVAPPETPLVIAIFGWIRRTFDNSTPAINYRTTETEQVDDTHVTGYLNPSDADGDSLTFHASSTAGATVTFDPNTPGKFTYTAPEDWNGESELVDTVTFTVSDAASTPHIHGLPGLINLITFGLLGDSRHTATQTVQITLPPTDQNEAPVVGQPAYSYQVEAQYGRVSGSLNVTDPDDGDDLTFRLDPNSPVSPVVGTVDLDQDTGAWSFTPTARSRVLAYNTADVEEHVTFTILVSDGQHEVPVVVDTPIDPAPQAPIRLAFDGSFTNGVVTGADGTAYQTVSANNGTASIVTVVRPDGSTAEYQLPGQAEGFEGVKFGEDGTAYQVTRSVSAGQWVTIVTALHPDGSAPTTWSVPGQPQWVGFTPGETSQGVIGYAVTYDTSPLSYAITQLNPNGATSVPHELPGYGGTPTIGVDGTAALVSYTIDPITGGNIYSLTVVHPDATGVDSPLTGNPQGLVVAPNGSVYVTSYDYTAEVGAMKAVHPSGAVTDESIGYPVGQLIVDPDGNAYQASYTRDPDTGQLHYTVTGMYPDGSESSYDGADIMSLGIATDGTVFGYKNDATAGHYTQVLFNPDGTTTERPLSTSSAIFDDAGNIYLVQSNTDPVTGGLTYTMTTVGLDGTQVEYALPGRPYVYVILGPDGTPYALNSTVDASGTYTFHATALNPDGTTTDHPLHGVLSDLPRVSPDGTTYQLTEDGSVYYMAIFRVDQSVTDYALPGDPAGGVYSTSDGTAYLTTQASDGAYLVIMDTGGSTNAHPLPGTTAYGGVVTSPEGTVYQYSYDPDADSYWVSVVLPDGAITDHELGSNALLGEITVAPDGTAYHTGYDPDTFDTVVTVFHVDGTVSEIVLPGGGQGNVAVAPDGTAYQTTLGNLWIIAVPAPNEPSVL